MILFLLYFTEEHTHTFQQKFNVPSDQGLLVLTGDLSVNEVISTNDSSDLILKWINFFVRDCECSSLCNFSSL